MEQLIDFINIYANYITIVNLALFVIAFISFFIVINSLNKTKKQYQILLKGMENKNLEEIILNNSYKIKNLEEYLDDNNNKLVLIDEKLSQCLKKVSLERYNAFQGIGGEQSFSVAMLDDNGNGIILSSIHGRDDARTYAKTVINGKSTYNLSEEEKRVLSNALNKNS
ncbi:MAG: hypothetical protein PWQ67_2053 [Clostridia bacterium]|nr:hypothetical protein [Clostridia bacterium]MDN5323599.1 hypothetical protein [Clostridia bacterium]